MQPAAVGPYTIERELGNGGMGVVFLATDPRLDRKVAIKALPEHLATDADRLARFQREAKVLASLSHPAIGAIYGLEQAQGRQYLVLEFVEGQTLADRLTQGAIAVDETLALARQIAEALEVAHEKGVIHRDLKPANIMLTPEGAVKVLDFGLARTADGTPGSSLAPGPVRSLGDSPTLPAHSPTIPGAIMGTAGYMSPEQARGKPVDKRSDIFSFGCVVYEMLTGVGPFPGETVTDSLGAILHREPEWSRLPEGTPVRIRELLRTCMAKDRRNRLHDIGDARLEIERALAGQDWVQAAAVTAPARSAGLRWAVPGAIVVTGLLAGGAGWLLAGRLAPTAPALAAGAAQTYYVAATVEAKPSFGRLVGIAPDARFLVYTAWPELPPESTRPTGVLVVRRLDRDETTVIEGTEGAREAALSPDGRWLAFAALKERDGTRGTLKKIALENGRPTGRPETVCELASGVSPTLCWVSDREIAFSPNFGGVIQVVSATGGEPRDVLREDQTAGIESWGDFAPLVPGESILATRWSFVGQKIRYSTEVIELATGKRTVVLPDAGRTKYVPDQQGGYLIATRNTQTSLIAVRFDVANRRTIGEPVTVWAGSPIEHFCVARGGTLAITTRPAEVPDRRLAWIDDKGQPQPIPGMMRSYGDIAISRDGGRVLAGMDAAGTAELVSECWVQDLSRRTSTRIAIQGAMIGMVWHPDGQHITYGLARDGGFSIVQRRADGSGEPVLLYASPDSRTLLAPTAWSPDGKTLAFVQVDLSTDSADAWVLRQDGSSAKWAARMYLKTPANEDVERISSDGKWVIIGSAQSGRQELYVQPFTGDGEADGRAGRRQISTSGGGASWWSEDGKEIRYLDNDGQVLSVQTTTEPAFSAAEPKVLYSIKDLKTRSRRFGPDGRLMVVLQGQSEQTTASVGVVVNFMDELRAKLPPAK